MGIMGMYSLTYGLILRIFLSSTVAGGNCTQESEKSIGHPMSGTSCRPLVFICSPFCKGPNTRVPTIIPTTGKEFVGQGIYPKPYIRAFKDLGLRGVGSRLSYPKAPCTLIVDS